MSMPEEEFKRSVEEFKELGHECRYRDQLMVQEFGLSMVATGLAINATLSVGQMGSIVIQLFGALFLSLLALHLRNTNQDRLFYIARKKKLSEPLGYAHYLQNPASKERLSGPRWMIRFTAVLALAWAGWLIWSLIMAYDIFGWFVVKSSGASLL